MNAIQTRSFVTGGGRSFRREHAVRCFAQTGSPSSCLVAEQTCLHLMIDGSWVLEAWNYGEDGVDRWYRAVTGERASAMPLGPQAFTSWREPTSLQVGSRVEHFEAVDAYAVMVENVSAAVDGGAGWVVPLTESLRAAEILDAVAASGSGPASSP